jgi:GNAT superfamily N-acetyltransferase
MQPRSLLHEAMSVYFAAKVRMFADAPSFQLLSVGPLKCFHNHPSWPEVDGFYAVDGETKPEEVISAIRAYQPAPEHMVTIFTSVPEAIRRSYEKLGYYPLPHPQPFLSKSLVNIPPVKPAEGVPSVSLVETPADRDFLNSRGRIMEPAHLHHPSYRYYYIRQDDEPVCWGRCVVSPEAIYVAGMETVPQHRRHGLAAALMTRMHTDAADSEAKQSVLCSTAMGFGLYKKLGYEMLAYMQSFAP